MKIGRRTNFSLGTNWTRNFLKITEFKHYIFSLFNLIFIISFTFLIYFYKMDFSVIIRAFSRNLFYIEQIGDIKNWGWIYFENKFL